MDTRFDVAVVGGGIVGTAIAMTLAGARRRVVVVESANRVAAHQSGHNSGVIHSGLYYRPGSLKALNCVRGREALYRFCAVEGIPHRRCGKLVVATSQDELAALRALAVRGAANGLHEIRRIEGPRLQEYEPAVRGLAGLWVAETGVVDFAEVTRAYARRVEEEGGEVRTGTRFRRAVPADRGLVLETNRGTIHTRMLVCAAGLQADRVARACGVAPNVAIVPFRGEYYELVPERSELVRTLIYPVPNPALPFLGLHLTRTIRDRVEAGPNAVLALARDRYEQWSFSPRDVLATVAFPGFWSMAARWWRVGIQEIGRTVSRDRFVREVRRLVPQLERDDLRRAGAGVRAQAVDRKGTLLDDFHIVEGDRALHILNAPSPAATASLSIGQTVASMVEERLRS